MTQEELASLVERAKADEVQTALKPGFQVAFVPNVIEQFERTGRLSERQIELLENIVTSCEGGTVTKPSKFAARRYEGYDRRS